MTNLDDIEYWRTYGRIEDEVNSNGRQAKLIEKSNIVESCILQNEIVVQGKMTIAVPYIIKSFKPTGFVKERLNVKASYQESLIIKQ